MKITLDEDVVELAVTEYLNSKGFVATDIDLKQDGSYGPIVAEAELDDGKPLDEESQPENGS